MEQTLNSGALDLMMGRTYMINTHNYRFMYWQNGGDCIRIVTDQKIFEVASDNLDEFIDECLPVTDEELEEQANSLVVAKTEDMRTIKDVLLDNIQKVQKDEKYIPQARSINNDVNSLINIYKTEIMLARELKKNS